MEILHAGPGDRFSRTITGDKVRVELEQAPRRYYWHGWQSWSLAAWVEAARPLPVPQPYFLHPMHIDPAYAFHPRLHGSWVGAVERPHGQVLLLGSLGLDAHVDLDGAALAGWYETGAGDWLVAQGEETAVFDAYARELRKRLGKGANILTGAVWSSWYSLYTDIDEHLLGRIFDGLSDLPFEVLQVDDGWQRSIGDWDANDKFPSGMEAMARRIRATGRRAGLWLAPLIAARSSRVFRAHPDWFLRDARGRLVSAGFNWGEQLYALDTTRPVVLEWLGKLMRRVREWGYDYLKLDFLYGGALPGVRREPMPREAALRQALQALRQAMGPDAFFLGCGVPILPSLGICDALRVGPDVWTQWESTRNERWLHNPAVPGGRTAIRTTVNRLWLQPLVIPDPDVVYFRSMECELTPDQKSLLQALALICGFRATSDPPQWLSSEESQHLREFLRRVPEILRVGPQRFLLDGTEVDYTTASELTQYAGLQHAAESAFFGWLANHVWVLRIDEWFRRRAAAKRLRRLRERL